MPKAPRTRPAMTPAERARILADIARHDSVMDKQIAGWIDSALRTATSVAAGNTDLITAFWIRVYGVLTDVRRVLEEQLASIEKVGANREPTAAVLAELMSMPSAFTEDELIYLGYRRHVECHPLQNGYRLLTRDGIREKITHRASGTEQSPEETDAAIVRVLRQHDSEDAIARNFASRLVDPLTKFQRASFAWCGKRRGA